MCMSKKKAFTNVDPVYICISILHFDTLLSNICNSQLTSTQRSQIWDLLLSIQNN